MEAEAVDETLQVGSLGLLLAGAQLFFSTVAAQVVFPPDVAALPTIHRMKPVMRTISAVTAARVWAGSRMPSSQSRAVL